MRHDERCLRSGCGAQESKSPLRSVRIFVRSSPPPKMPETVHEMCSMAQSWFKQAHAVYRRAAYASFQIDDQELMLRRLRNAVHRLGTASNWYDEVVEDMKLTVSMTVDIKRKRIAERVLWQLLKYQQESKEMYLDAVLMFNRKFKVVRRKGHECM